MWVKCHTTLLDHRKLRRTASQLRIKEVALRGHLITLWLNVLNHAPDGILNDWSEEDIAHYAQWDGDSHLFVFSLIDTNWLDDDDGTLIIHNWESHSERLRMSKVRSQNRERQAKHRARLKDSNASVTRDVTLSNAGEEKRGEERSIGEGKKGEILEVFEHYRGYHPRSHKKPHCRMREWRKIQARLDEGCTVEDLKAAIDGCHISPYHMGENESGRKYDSLELIVRDGSKVSMFLEVSAGPVTKEARKKSIRATSSWLERSKRDG